jgi:hypothetical protein
MALGAIQLLIADLEAALTTATEKRDAETPA